MKQRRTLDRREFLKYAAAAALAAGCERRQGGPLAGRDDERFARPALYYKRLADRRIRCELCPQFCEVGDMERGFCGARENRGGDYYTLVYGRPCSTNKEPIEKQGLLHYLPGSMSLSFATAGCNLQCKNCQNWQMSQVRPEQLDAYYIPPENLVNKAKYHKAPVISATYTEPVVFFEYMMDTAIEGNKRGIRTVMTSAGYISPEPLKRACAQLAAIKIDLKSMRDDFYRDNCAGALQPVLDAIEVAHEHAKWLEVVYLVIPTLNDSDEEIRDCARWMKEHVGPQVPLQFLRFYPAYRLKNLPQTPAESLTRCRRIALDEGLHYVYVGNVPDHEGQHTSCHHCGRMLIERQGWEILRNEMADGKCPQCGAAIPGVWS